jgi:hypothetical protein
MGYLPEPTPEMGEYWVEVRRESFYLGGQDPYVPGDAIPCPGQGCTVIGDHKHRGEGKYMPVRHGITLYMSPNGRQGTAEILIEDIPKIRAALDQVERVFEGSKE